MINIRYMFAAAALAGITMSTPAVADSRHGRGWDNDSRSNDRRGWRSNNGHDRQQGRWDYDNRDDRRDERRAYANGYRDGARQPYYRQSGRQPGYGNGWDRGPVYHGNVGYGSGYRQPAYRGGNYWVGHNGRIHCRRNDGSTGVIVGAVAGGTLGNILAQNGDKRLGSIIGGTLGAILGKELDKGNGVCR